MKTLILITTTAACCYFGFKMYNNMAVAIRAKKIHEQNKRDLFWESQQSFEE